MSLLLLQVRNLAARRGGRLVFRGLAFAVHGAGALTVVGANGSGKSTLLRILAGLLQPDAGALHTPDPARRDIHYIGHLDAVKPDLTVAEQIIYWQALDPSLRGDSDAALAAWQLDHLRDRPIGYLSAGQKRRLSLSRLLLKPATLWLLDEPATALDRAGRQLLEAAIARHRADGGAVIVATHQPLDLPDTAILELGGPS